MTFVGEGGRVSGGRPSDLPAGVVLRRPERSSSDKGRPRSLHTALHLISAVVVLSMMVACGAESDGSEMPVRDLIPHSTTDAGIDEQLLTFAPIDPCSDVRYPCSAWTFDEYGCRDARCDGRQQTKWSVGDCVYVYARLEVGCDVRPIGSDGEVIEGNIGRVAFISRYVGSCPTWTDVEMFENDDVVYYCLVRSST